MTIPTIGTREDRFAVVALGAADWLRLSAAPTFAVMAVLMGVLGGGAPDMLCAHDASWLSGMVGMYMLMSAFHLAPWLKLISGRRRKASGIAPHLSLPMRDACH
jgi:hypothetical protein